MSVQIVTVAYKSSQTIADCFRSALPVLKQEDRFTLVDNSADLEDLSPILSEFPEIWYMNPKANLGFATGCNLGARQSDSDYIFFLNPDATIIDDCVERLVSHLENNKDIGLIAPRFITRGGDEKVVYANDPREKIFGDNLPGEIASVTGAAVMLPRKLFEQLGGFDEDFFLYGEDIDLCRRVRKAGYRVELLKDVAVNHIGGHSEKDAGREAVEERKTRASLLLMKKHLSPKKYKLFLRKDRRAALWRMASPWLAALLGHKASILRVKNFKKRLELLNRALKEL